MFINIIPILARTTATSLPIPAVPPVTITTLPVKSVLHLQTPRAK